MPPTGVARRQQLFEVWIRPVPNNQAVFALRAALREVDALIEKGLSQEEFEAHRAFLGKYSLQFATNTSDRLGYRIDDRFYGIDGEGHLARFAEMMESMTRDEVNTAIRKHLQSDDLVIAMVVDDAAAITEQLTSGDPTPMHYGELAKSAEVLAEDKEIEAYGLKIDAAKVTVVPVDSMFEK